MGSGAGGKGGAGGAGGAGGHALKPLESHLLGSRGIGAGNHGVMGRRATRDSKWGRRDGP